MYSPSFFFPLPLVFTCCPAVQALACSASWKLPKQRGEKCETTKKQQHKPTQIKAQSFLIVFIASLKGAKSHRSGWGRWWCERGRTGAMRGAGRAPQQQCTTGAIHTPIGCPASSNLASDSQRCCKRDTDVTSRESILERWWGFQVLLLLKQIPLTTKPQTSIFLFQSMKSYQGWTVYSHKASLSTALFVRMSFWKTTANTLAPATP